MSDKAEQKIKLELIRKGGKKETVEFAFDHALALLRRQARTGGNNGYKIADKAWKFENNEIKKA